jgi:glycerol uptake operon antiterminator
MLNIEEILAENPIIAAIRDDKGFERALAGSSSIVFLLYGSVITIPELCKKLKEAKKTVFIHMDLIDGLKGDASAIEYIKKYADPEGIITTKISNIRYAKQQELLTIQRIFIIDSHSLVTGIKGINETRPSAVEVMPGVASKIIEKLKKDIKVPVIAGGLIETKEDIIDALSSGANAISTTKESLWKL